MRAKQRDVRGNGTQRMYESPPQNAEYFFMRFAPWCERAWEGYRLGAIRHNELVCWTRFIQSYLHKLPRWSIRVYHTKLGNWNVFGSLKQFRLALISLEKQKTFRLSSLNAPFSLIILHRHQSENCLPYWQWVSMRKTRICVQWSNFQTQDWLTIHSLNRIYTVTWKQS